MPVPEEPEPALVRAWRDDTYDKGRSHSQKSSVRDNLEISSAGGREQQSVELRNSRLLGHREIRRVDATAGRAQSCP